MEVLVENGMQYCPVFLVPATGCPTDTRLKLLVVALALNFSSARDPMLTLDGHQVPISHERSHPDLPAPFGCYQPFSHPGRQPLCICLDTHLLRGVHPSSHELKYYV